MKKFAAFVVLVAAMASTIHAADVPPPLPKAASVKVVRFPDFPQEKPKTIVKTDPDAPIKLGPGQWYVIASSTPQLILTDGTGEVTVVQRAPGFMLPVAQAIGWPANPKDPEFVTWGPEYPYIYAIKAAKSGDVELRVMPSVNAIDEKTKEQIPLAKKDVSKKLLTVDDGTGPRPPTPIVIVPPTPKVDPTPAIITPVKGFRVLFVYETEQNLTKEQRNIMDSTKIAGYLDTACVKAANGQPEWRKWDKGTIEKDGGPIKESALWQQIWKDTKPKLGGLPQIVIISDQSGNTFPLPATEEATLAFLKQYGG